MRACIKIIDGPSIGKKLWLLAGQIAEIGRNSSVDLAVAQDSQLADIHFIVQCNQTTCRLQDTSDGAGVSVNGEAADDIDLKDGDKIKAGNTTFELTIEDPIATGSAPIEQETPPENQTTWIQVEAKTAAEICVKFTLDDGKIHIKDWYTPEQFYQVLREKDCFPDALRFLSHALSKEDAIWWSHESNQILINEDSPQTDLQAQEATLLWLQDPSDENRRAAMKAAENANCETAAAMTAMAVFFSGGSVVAPELDPVPPGEFITAQCITGAVILAAAQNEALPYPTNFHPVLQLGDEVAKGSNTWKQEES